MGFGDLAREVRKNSQKPAPSVAQNDMADAIMEESRPAPAPKQDISYRDSEIQGFVPQGRGGMSRQSVDSRHGSIIRNIASESNINSQRGGGASWEECKHRKTNSGTEYCAEYHSLCAKQRCNRARK
jgi:hypothetical protein